MSSPARRWAARLDALRTRPPCANSANSANSSPSEAAAGPIGTIGTIGTPSQGSAAVAPAEVDLKASSPDSDFQSCEERAAIIEEGAGVPREWAEGRAILATMPPPPDWSAPRWARLQDDADTFVDAWAARAAELGWGVHDAFGVDPVRSVARLDVSGLVPLLNGSGLVAITAEAAEIRTAGGEILRYRKNTRASGGVPIWQLQLQPDTL
jgi:hypothetical protein